MDFFNQLAKGLSQGWNDFTQQMEWSTLNQQVNQLYNQGKFNEAILVAKQALILAQSLHPGDHPDLATSLNNLALLYEFQGRYSEAEPLYKQALEMYQRLFTGDHAAVANSLNNLAALYYSQGRYSEAETCYKQALEMYQRLFTGDHAAVANSLNNLALLYYSQERYSEAEPLYKQTLEMRQRLFNGDYADVATSLNNLAEVYRIQGRYNEAEPLHRQALEIYQRLFNGVHPYVATSLNNLALLYYFQGRYSEAEPLYKQALEMRQRLFNGDHADMATSLNGLAVLYQSQGRYSEAEPLHKQALEMRQRLFNGDHADVATSLNNLAELYRIQGRYSEAELLLQQELKMTQRLFNGDHVNVATSLNNLAAIYSYQGRYSEAELLLQQELKMTQRLFNGDHADVARSLNNLAEVYRIQGRYTEAESLYKQALEMRQRLFKDDHSTVASNLNGLAVLYQSQGRYSEAEPLHKQALEMKQRLFKGEYPTVVSSLNNLATLYSYQGRYSKAESLYKQALEITQGLFNGPTVAVSLHNLAAVYRMQGRYTESEALHKQALEITQGLFNGDHVDVASILNGLAVLYSFQGRYSEAEPLHKQVLGMFQRLFNGDHPDVALSLNNLAQLYNSQGHYSESESLFQQALGMFQRLFNGDHPHVALSLNNLGLLLEATNRPQEAFDKMQQAIEMETRLIQRNFAFSSEQERLQSIKNNRYKFEHFLSLVSQYFSNSPEQVQKALDIVLKRKSLTAAALAAFNFAIHSQRYSHLKPQFNKLRSLQEQLFHRTYNPPLPDAETPIEDYRIRWQQYQKDIAELEQQCQQLEKQLATQVPEIQLDHQTLDRRAVALELPANTVLVEYVRFNRYDFTATKGENWKSAEYWVFILPAQNPDAVQMISLGEAQPIDDLIDKVRQVLSLENPPSTNEMGSRHKNKPSETPKQPLINRYQYQLQYPNALRQKVFDPLLTILNADQNIFIAPDFSLSLIPFGVLPLDETGNQLLRDHYQISYLSSGRDVLRWKIKSDRIPAEPLIIANPNFNYPHPPNLAKPKTKGLTQSDAQSSRTKPVFQSLSSDEFSPLPETETLANSIAEKLNISNLYLGDRALEPLFAQKTCPGILLIATHGYFESENPYIKLMDELQTSPAGEEDQILAKNQNLINSQLLLVMENQAETFSKQGKENQAQWLKDFAKKLSTQYQISPAPLPTENPFDRFSIAPVNNAMIRGGLAFAGANTWREGQQLPTEAGKGVLLAQDVAGIDLWDNELTILIACQTGLGDVQLGEGVFGLRRAFAVAGCQALIMSLWSVPTRASLLLMDQFLTLVETGLGKRKALLKAQSYIRNITIQELQQIPLGREIIGEFIEERVIPKGFIESNPNYQLLSHPYFWGAWISQGEL
ncbi:tetratricopeptide TPR_2 [Planktothrix agardhii CCAP 1459/11A]|uniref:Tetratricopeptide TPR_2 n=1 Tax=Planktothrix agardhii CCAP 1459/11A TaxID=282420 RepID=A0A4P5ZHZ7_PLAAG|nr:CHAT domain-containing tetratricopeptide repeat protein [Planktothrix agardhii]GDZ95766.1 tetratricopeptide TPR_2 [Planktothrix agardhii CCAP 1459/11A]